MGACISTHHKASETKVQKVSFESTKPDHKMIIHPLSSNDKLSFMDGHVAVKPQLPNSQPPATFSEYGMICHPYNKLFICLLRFYTSINRIKGD